MRADLDFLSPVIAAAIVAVVAAIPYLGLSGLIGGGLATAVVLKMFS